MNGRIKARIEKLMAESKKITWKPRTIFLDGEPGNYELTVQEWDGVPGSARNGDHIKKFLFEDKTTAMAFANSAFSECEHMFDMTFPTDAEWAATRPQAVLEAQAEKEGIPHCVRQ